jgi:UDP-N-acetylglucosamine--N-acetylmuramyl-(pentapeptide) pyrophosphoryl-undecaprenol N-acetylglucosamine transferase
LYVGAYQGVEQQLVERSAWRYAAVETGQLRGRAPWVVARNLLQMARGVRRSSQIMSRFRPDVVFVTGGYVCAPVVVAARRQGIPVLVYLPDVTPGLAVGLLSHLAQAVAVTCAEAGRHFGAKAVITGYPVRRALSSAASDRAASRRLFGLSAEGKVLLVFGGSRGAHSINRALSACLADLLEVSEVVHITGSQDRSWIEANADRLPLALRSCYHTFEYLHDEMAQALASADLVVSRAGAAVLGEYPLLGLPSLLVPYPFAGRHQRANAEYLAGHGAAEILDDSALEGMLGSTVLRLLNDENKLRDMGAAVRKLAKPEAAAKIGELLRQMAASGAAHRLNRG